MRESDVDAIARAVRGYSNGGRVGVSNTPVPVWHLIDPRSYRSRRKGSYHQYPTMVSLCGDLVETEAMIRARSVEHPDRVIVPDGIQRPCRLCSPLRPYLTRAAIGDEWIAATVDLVAVFERLNPVPNLGVGVLAVDAG